MKLVSHGSLQEIVPPVVEIEANSVSELLNGVQKLYDVKDRRHVHIEGFETVDDIFGPTDAEEVHIYPDFGGAKGGKIMVAVGFAVAAAAVIASGGALAAPVLWGASSYGSIALVGASIALGGLMQMMSPSPQFGGSEGPEGSYIIDTKKNTVKIGTPIPIIYGEHRAGGHIISYDVDAVDPEVAGNPEAAENTPPSVSLLSRNLQIDGEKVAFSWSLPSDEEINSVVTQDEFGVDYQPFENGRDEIDHIALFHEKWRRRQTPNGSEIHFMDSIEKIAEINPTEMFLTEVTTYYRFGVQLVYSNGGTSDIVWDNVDPEPERPDEQFGR